MLTMPSRPRAIWVMWLNGCWGTSRRRRMVQDPGNSSLWRPHSWPPFSPCWWVPPLKCEKCKPSLCFQQFSLIYLFSLQVMQCYIDLPEPQWFKEVTLPNSVREFGVNREEFKNTLLKSRIQSCRKNHSRKHFVLMTAISFYLIINLNHSYPSCTSFDVMTSDLCDLMNYLRHTCTYKMNQIICPSSNGFIELLIHYTLCIQQ